MTCCNYGRTVSTLKGFRRFDVRFRPFQVHVYWHGWFFVIDNGD